MPFDRFGYPTNHEQFLQVTGIIEITCGTLMFIGPAFLRAISSFVLIAIVSTVMYCMHALHHPQEHLVPAGACLGLLMLERIFSDG